MFDIYVVLAITNLLLAIANHYKGNTVFSVINMVLAVAMAYKVGVSL